MSDLFGGTTEIPGRMSPGEFSIKSEQIALGYGELFNHAFQSAADRKLKEEQGAWPKPRNNGFDPRSSGDWLGETLHPDIMQ